MSLKSPWIWLFLTCTNPVPKETIYIKDWILIAVLRNWEQFQICSVFFYTPCRFSPRNSTALKVTATVRFHRPVRVHEVVVLCVVFLVVLPTIKEILIYILLYINYILCFYC
jgi:hypothetical protein